MPEVSIGKYGAPQWPVFTVAISIPGHTPPWHALKIEPFPRSHIFKPIDTPETTEQSNLKDVLDAYEKHSPGKILRKVFGRMNVTQPEQNYASDEVDVEVKPDAADDFVNFIQRAFVKRGIRIGPVFDAFKP